MNTKVKSRRNPSATERRYLRRLLMVRTLDAHAIGRRIAQSRAESGGLTQEELGDLLNVSTRSVQGYEAGDVIPYKHLERLSEIFQRPFDWLLHGEDEGSVPDPETLARRLEGIEAGQEELRQIAARLLEVVDRLAPPASQEAPTSPEPASVRR